MTIEKVSKSDRSRCFFDIQIDGDPVGRVVMELFDDLVPRTTKNFLMLCTGQAGLGKVTEKPLHYKGSLFHRVIKNFMVQGGDFSAGNGTGGESIYGGVFDDESFLIKHDQPFMLSMANRGKDTNGSQFFITTKPAPHLDGVHVVFGKVISGQEIITQIENLKVNAKCRPVADVIIANCGQLIRKRAADDVETEVKKSKKHKKRKREKDKESNSDYEESQNVLPSIGPQAVVNEPEIISSVKADDLPEVPTTNKFLMRRSKTPENATSHSSRPPVRHSFAKTRSGHRVKGRGSLRFRTPSDDEGSRVPVHSRSRSATPPHWKREERRLISMKELQDRIKIKLEQEEKEIQEKQQKQAENATNETETFGYRLPVFPPPQQVKEIRERNHSQTESSRSEHIERGDRRWPNDMYQRDRDRMARVRDQERDNTRRDRRYRDEGTQNGGARSRSPRFGLRNGVGGRYPQSPDRSISHNRRPEEDRMFERRNENDRVRRRDDERPAERRGVGRRSQERDIETSKRAVDESRVFGRWADNRDENEGMPRRRFEEEKRLSPSRHQERERRDYGRRNERRRSVERNNKTSEIERERELARRLHRRYEEEEKRHQSDEYRNELHVKSSKSSSKQEREIQYEDEGVSIEDGEVSPEKKILVRRQRSEEKEDDEETNVPLPNSTLSGFLSHLRGSKDNKNKQDKETSSTPAKHEKGSKSFDEKIPKEREESKGEKSISLERPILLEKVKNEQLTPTKTPKKNEATNKKTPTTEGLPPKNVSPAKEKDEETLKDSDLKDIDRQHANFNGRERDEDDFGDDDKVNEREEYCGRTHDEVDINMESNIANVETQEGLQFTSQDHDESSKDVDKSCDHFDEDLIKSSYFVEEKEVTNENIDEPEDKGDKMEGSIKEEKIEQITSPVKSPTKQKEKGKQTEYEISSVNLLNENIPMEAEAEPEEEEFIFKQLILPQKTKDEEYSTPTSLHKSPASNLSTPKKHSPALKNVLKVENDNDKESQQIPQNPSPPSSALFKPERSIKIDEDEYDSDENLTEKKSIKSAEKEMSKELNERAKSEESVASSKKSKKSSTKSASTADSTTSSSEDDSHSSSNSRSSSSSSSSASSKRSRDRRSRRRSSSSRRRQSATRRRRSSSRSSYRRRRSRSRHRSRSRDYSSRSYRRRSTSRDRTRRNRTRSRSYRRSSRRRSDSRDRRSRR
uniref:peptidylprolyl isomerase n=1 Tax=Meloidogyne floridensis TaxID=298350 RepID=A0A915NIT5_9BILA